MPTPNAASATSTPCTPTGVAFDSSGNLYVADSLNNRIRKIAGSNIATVAGNGGFGSSGVPGNSGDGGAPTAAQLNGPQGVAVDGAGNLYIADTQNHKVRVVSGGVIGTFAGNGTAGFAGDGGAATAAVPAVRWHRFSCSSRARVQPGSTCRWLR